MSGPFAEGAGNIHAVALVAGRRGILIEGPSGAGKTTLALAIIDRLRAEGRHGAFVADDRCLVAAAGGRLVARPHPALAGRAELAGLGIVGVAHAPAAVIDLVVRLVPPDEAERMPAPATAGIAGVTLPRLDVARRHAGVAARLALAHPALA